MTQRTGSKHARRMERVSFLGAQLFRAPAAWRGGRAVFPAGNKHARGASSRRWVGVHSRKNVESTNRRQHMSARFSHRTSLAAIVAAPLLVGVVTHGRWLYAGDGDSTLKVFDLDAPDASALKETKSTRRAGDVGDPTRVDEMALTTDGELLLTVNNAAEPPFATLFAANGDRNHSSVRELSHITINATLFPDTPGIEQPTWDPKTKRFYVSVPILGKPGGCGTATCDGGLMVIDPETVTPGNFVLGAFNPATNSGVLQLSNCGPNGATVGPHANLLLGCTPANNPTNDSTLVINATTKHFSHVNGIVGSDEVWFNK